MFIPTNTVGIAMAQTVVDERGRVLIPEEIRESSGLDRGTVVAVEKQEDRIIIKLVRKSKRTWKQLRGLTPQRTGKPEWPTPEEIKSIWR